MTHFSQLLTQNPTRTTPDQVVLPYVGGHVSFESGCEFVPDPNSTFEEVLS
jgi:hypothetical protein